MGKAACCASGSAVTCGTHIRYKFSIASAISACWTACTDKPCNSSILVPGSHAAIDRRRRKRPSQRCTQHSWETVTPAWSPDDAKNLLLTLPCAVYWHDDNHSIAAMAEEGRINTRSEYTPDTPEVQSSTNILEDEPWKTLQTQKVS